MSARKAIVFLADGFEEVEAVTPIDFLRRADLDVIIAGVGCIEPRGAHDVVMKADIEVRDIDFIPDAVVLPGGMPGSVNLSASEDVRRLVLEVDEAGGLVSSICAAPAVALAPFGVIRGRKFTCYPGFEDKVKDGIHSTDRVVRDGNLITSRGPGTAAEFSVELVRYLTDETTADGIFKGTLIK